MTSFAGRCAVVMALALGGVVGGCGEGGPDLDITMPDDPPPSLALAPVHASVPPTLSGDPWRSRYAALAAHSTAPGELYLFAADANLYRRSANPGAAWSLVGPLPGDGHPAAFVAPSDGDRLYFRDPSGWYVSPDGGASWESRGPGRELLAAHPSDPDVVYARYAPDPQAPVSALHRSTDAGVTFTALPDMLPGARVMPMVVVFDPRDPQRMLVGTGSTEGVFATDDGGQTWTRRLTTHYAVTELAVNPARPDVVIAADYFNVWRSTDFGRTWTRLFQSSGGPGRFVFSRDVAGILLNNRPLRWSLDDGETWETAGYGAADGIVAASAGGGFHVMPDWWGVYDVTAADPGLLVPSGTGLPVSPVRGASRIGSDRHGNLYVHAGGGGVLHKAPGDTLWNVLPVPLLFTDGIVLGGDQSDGLQVYGRVVEGYSSVRILLETTDGGTTWTRTDGPAEEPDEIVAAPWDGDVLFSRRERRSPQVDVSRDGGATWSSHLLGTEDLRGFVWRADPPLMVAVTQTEIFTCVADPGQWQRYVTGMPYINGVFIDARFEDAVAVASVDSLRARNGGPPNPWRALPAYGRAYAVGPARSAPWNPALALAPWRGNDGWGLLVSGQTTFRFLATGSEVTSTAPDGDTLWMSTSAGLRQVPVVDLE